MKEENAIVKKISGVTGLMAQKYNMEPENFNKTFKATVFKSAKREPTNEELAMMMLVCHEYDLNPFVGQIFAFPTKNGGIAPVVGIDGFSTIAERNKDYDGYEIEFSDKFFTPMQKDKEGKDTAIAESKPAPEWCEIKVFRKNLSRPVVVREYFDEVYCPPKSGYPGPWQSHPKRMLRHKTIIQGLRLAFAITGVYDEDEAKRISEAQVIDVTAGKPDVEMPKALDEKTSTPAPTAGESVQTSTGENGSNSAATDVKPNIPANDAIPAGTPISPVNPQEEGMSEADKEAVKKLFTPEEKGPQTPDEFRKAISKLIMLMCGDDVDDAKAMPKTITAWKNKDGKDIPGKDSTRELTDKQCNVVYGKVKKLYEESEQYRKPEAVE